MKSDIIAGLDPILGDPFWEGLIGYWPFWGEAGESVYDLSGNGNHLSFGSGASAPSWASCEEGQSLQFANSHYALSPIGIYNSDNDVTLNVWFKVDAYDDWDTIIGQLNGGGTGRSWILVTNADQFASAFGAAGGGDLTFGPCNTTDLFHLAMTRRGNLTSIYYQGLLVDTDVPNDDHAAGEIIWGTEKTASNFFSGHFFRTFLHNRAMTATEIARLNLDPSHMLGRDTRPVYFFVPNAGGGVVYQELNLGVSAAATVGESDLHQKVETGKGVSAAATVGESDVQQKVETGKGVIAAGTVGESDVQQKVETGKDVSAAASVSCTDLKVFFELNLTVNAAGSVEHTEAYTMIETGKEVAALASLSINDAQVMAETDLLVSAEGDVSCVDSVPGAALAHIAAFMILRQCTQ